MTRAQRLARCLQPAGCDDLAVALVAGWPAATGIATNDAIDFVEERAVSEGFGDGGVGRAQWNRWQEVETKS